MNERNMEPEETPVGEPVETPVEERQIPVMDDDYFGDCTHCVDW
jgi:hypothetical protein